MRSAWKVRVAGWMESAWALGPWASDTIFANCGGGGDGPVGDDGAGDAARILLFAIMGDDAGQIALGGFIDQIGGAFARQAHAHVQRAFLAERKAARRRIELEGRNAQIQHHAVGRVGEFLHPGEFALRPE